MADSSSFVYEELISFPTSFIKSPGDLLRKVKTEDFHSSCTMSYGTRSTSSAFTMGISLVKEPLLPLETFDEGPEEVLDFSVEIRSFFNISMTTKAHKYILNELSKLPQSFVDNLQLSIVLTDTPNATNEKQSMRTADFDSEHKATERLYCIIFYCFIARFPEVFSLWAELSGLPENPNTSEEMKEFLRTVRQKEIERSFYAVMINKKYPKTLDILKFKYLLSELDPKGFSERWFKDHNRSLKKRCRVRFEDDNQLYTV